MLAVATGSFTAAVVLSTFLGKPIRLPTWLLAAVLDLAEIRPLLGARAYGYLMLLAYLPWDHRRRLEKIAHFLCHAGLPDQGLATHEALLATYSCPEATPEELIVSYLQLLMFGSPRLYSDEYIFRQHVHYSRHFESDAPYVHWPNVLTLGRRLKIGYTCHIITNSTSTTLLQSLLTTHHRHRAEVFMYSDEPGVPDSVRELVEHWRDTSSLNASAFCDLIRKDGIDILLELNGHGLSNRYTEMARHPAPVQLSWYNYACTTGVPGIDYTLSSDDIEIEELQPYYSETIFRKRGTSHALSIGPHFPPANSSPFERNGYITFCSFGQDHKVSREQILLWCEILNRVPGSRFFMKAGALGSSPNRAAFAHHFKAGGVDSSRLILEGNSDYPTLLRRYWYVDIALDTFPGNGGTTTVEAIIMGVPTISLRGPRYSMQMGRAILESGGLAELVCSSREEFIAKAVALAGDPTRLSRYRGTLRGQFRQSRRCDIDKFTTELEDAFLEIWMRHTHQSTQAEVMQAPSRRAPSTQESPWSR